MKTKLLFLMPMAVYTLSCEPLNEGQGTARKADSRNREVETEDSSAVDTPPPVSDLYITGLELSPDGKSIILFKNGERVMSIKTGDLEEVGDEIDQHHFLNGHIFTEYNAPMTTVIKKDGNEFIRYDACEVLKGLLSFEGSIYTLGQSVKGEGFSLRADGEVVFESASGRVWGDLLADTSHPGGALYEDNGSIIFCYYKSGDGQSSPYEFKQWYLVKDGIQSQVMIPGSITEIYDLRIIDGHICIVGSQGLSTYPVLLIDSELYDLSGSAINATRDFRLVKDDGRIAFYGTTVGNGGLSKTGIWTRDGLQNTFDGKNNLILEHKGFHSFVGYLDGAISINSPWNKSEILKGPFHYITCWNLAVDDLHIHIIANPVDKEQKPILWSDGSIQEFGKDIFLTSVCVVN